MSKAWETAWFLTEKDSASSWVERKFSDPTSESFITFRGPWRYLQRIYDEQSADVTVAKGSQIGLSELAIRRCIHAMLRLGVDVLYVLPTETTAGDFSQKRIAPVIAADDEIAAAFDKVDNVHLKMAGRRAFYLRGSNADSKLISIPVGFLVIDEYDFCNRRKIDNARSRVAGQERWWFWRISTPTFPSMGIMKRLELTDWNRWLIECPNCRERMPLSWKSVKWDGIEEASATWQCAACEAPWTQAKKLELQAAGQWVPMNPTARRRGYHAPGLLNPKRTAADFVAHFVEARNEGSEEAMRIFWNQVLGEPYATAENQFTDEMIDLAVKLGGGRAVDTKGEKSVRCFAGLDIGAVHHLAIGYKEAEDKTRYVLFRELSAVEDVVALIEAYNVRCLVVDMLPYTEQVRALQRAVNRSRSGCVWLAQYKSIRVPLNWSETKAYQLLEMARTETIDRVHARMRQGKILFPVDAPDWVRLHLRAVVRSNEKDERTGNPVGRWKELEGRPDHALHAINYAEAAALSVPVVGSKVRIGWL